MGIIARGTKSASGTVNFNASTSAKASELNTDLNTIVAEINGNLDNDNIANDADILFTKVNLASALSSLTTAILPIIYPIGSVVTLGVATNPAVIWGFGTWTAIAGRVIVGIDAAQTEFDTLDETGGAKTVTLDVTQIPAHHHTYGTANAFIQGGAGTGGTDNGQLNTSDTGGGQAHDNMPPYIVKYCWQRTA